MFLCRNTETVAVGKLGWDLDGDLVLVPRQPRHVPEAPAQVGRPASSQAAPHTRAAGAAQPLVAAVQVTSNCQIVREFILRQDFKMTLCILYLSTDHFRICSLPRVSLGLNWKLSLFHRGSLAGSSQYFARLKNLQIESFHGYEV